MKQLVAVAAAMMIAVVASADDGFLTKPNGEAVDLGPMLYALMDAEFDCKARVADEWVGWHCQMAGVEVAVEGGAHGVRSIALQCPDLRPGTTAEYTDMDAIAMMLGLLLVFDQVSDDNDLIVDVVGGAKEVPDGEVFVLEGNDGVFFASRYQDQKAMVVVFRDTTIASAQGASVAASTMEAFPSNGG